MTAAAATYRRLDEDRYAVDVGGFRFTVRRCWYRLGGWQWEVPEVTVSPTSRTPVRGATRQAAVAAAHRQLRSQANATPSDNHRSQ